MRKLQKETSDKMDIGEKNVLGQRRAKWTTYTNLNMWFNTWEGVLIELGFSRLKREGEDCKGSVVFFVGQKYRIINLDETDGALDNTCGKRGGRPSFYFIQRTLVEEHIEQIIIPIHRQSQQAQDLRANPFPSISSSRLMLSPILVRS